LGVIVWNRDIQGRDRHDRHDRHGDCAHGLAEGPPGLEFATHETVRVAAHERHRRFRPVDDKIEDSRRERR
jgi:hypothetical protein